MCCCISVVAAILFCVVAVLVILRRRAQRVTNKTVVFLHPDLGIGGAERLVVDAALGLQAAGYTVHMVTTYHDPNRCFPETRSEGGPLPVTVYGDFLPRHVMGKGHVLCVTLRMLWAAAAMAVVGPPCEWYVVDQLATPVPLLRLLCGAARPVLFYCHFPDKLCDPSAVRSASRGLCHRLYRLVFDTVEMLTLMCASAIVFNSKFTKRTTHETFPLLQRRFPMTDDGVDDVLYPPINPESLDAAKAGPVPHNTWQLDRRTALLSINRFESKKNVELALDAFALFVQRHYDGEMRCTTPGKAFPSNVHLFLAGGYDERLPDNRTYMSLLKQKVDDMKLSSLVTFLPSILQSEKIELLKKCACVMYTPTGEHFGIVPIEAMLFSKPVIAVNLCGPLESIKQDGVYGRLMEPTAEKFCEAIEGLLESESARQAMGERARVRCLETFTLEAFTSKMLDVVARKMKKNGNSKGGNNDGGKEKKQ
eukprot:PhM_4_TR6335/c0_g1_i1/m.10/K03843/ALG2; alpha-1,3/alpha-1,6-mannosyltransferase